MTDEKEFTVTLDRWAYGGEAMGRLPDGRAVFVPFSLPGETVRVRLTEEKRGFARGQLLVLTICVVVFFWVIDFMELWCAPGIGNIIEMFGYYCP